MPTFLLKQRCAACKWCGRPCANAPASQEAATRNVENLPTAKQSKVAAIGPRVFVEAGTLPEPPAVPAPRKRRAQPAPPPAAPPASPRKHLVSLRLDADVIAAFKQTGKGWQSRINEALRRSLGC